MPGKAARRQSRGFTLLEMIVVIAILGLLAGLVITHGPMRSARVNLEASARALTGALQTARGLAIADDRLVTVRTWPAGFAIEGGRTWQLSAGQVMSPSRVTFTPEGQSSGGVITIQGGNDKVLVTVDWLTGQVRTD